MVTDIWHSCWHCDHQTNLILWEYESSGRPECCNLNKWSHILTSQCRTSAWTHNETIGTDPWEIPLPHAHYDTLNSTDNQLRDGWEGNIKWCIVLYCGLQGAKPTPVCCQHHHQTLAGFMAQPPPLVSPFYRLPSHRASKEIKAFDSDDGNYWIQVCSMQGNVNHNLDEK